ncbi:breast cancer type 2 susceptibility protein isoform X2 [Hoplias malabaricus]|uniref:breast cancer type 2 susceptibility protein isoform X2 n=1 Tax=Hoplias malabaricus TaxID=27720 RepID=UPI003461F832
MIENFFHQIEAELGPLRSDWFEELTAKTSKDGHCPGALQKGESSCTDEGMYKAPVETPVLDTQMSSTPRIFRHGGPQSPDSVLMCSPGPGMQSPLAAVPWTDSSPCLFGSAKDSQRFEKNCESQKKIDYFGLLDTPKTSLAQSTSAKRISESLGAQLNPDLSWSSSFNTPSAMSPTVILTKKETQTSPESLLKEKEVIIVRKLFPSLSKDTGSASESTSTAQHNATLEDGNAQVNAQRLDESFDHVKGVWKQTVPDIINDSVVRNTVESILDGTEDVLCIFFNNSSSALRRVKTKERIKKRDSSVSKEVKPPPLTSEHSTDQTFALKVDPDLNQSRTSSAVGTSPLGKQDFSQCASLSLSDVQDCKAKQDCDSALANQHINIVTVNRDSEQLDVRDHDTQPSISSCTAEHLKCCPEKSQLRNSLLAASPLLTFSRKPRKFVYRVQSPSPSPTGRQLNMTSGKSSPLVIDCLTEKHCTETSFANDCKHHEDDISTASVKALEQQGDTTVKQDNPGALNMDHGLDMTQLCKAFAEDFTQEMNLEKSQNTGGNHKGLIISNCTTQTVKTSEAAIKEECEKQCGGVDHQDFYSTKQPAFVTEYINLSNMSVTESTKPDSGFHTNISEFGAATISCGNTEPNLHPGFKTANNKFILVSPEAVKKAKATLDYLLEQQMTSAVSTEPGEASQNLILASPVSDHKSGSSHGLKIGMEAADFTPDGSSKAAAEHMPRSILLQTTESGFRTASNSSIKVSSVNLEKAKDIFKQLEEDNFDFHSSSTGTSEFQNVRNCRLPKCDLKSSHSDHNAFVGNCILTASQKADVTELCTMLEEAESQYEFTQFRQAKPSSKSLENTRMEKEWDPDIISGIDFDDSFNCDLEKQVSKKPHAKPTLFKQHNTARNCVQNGEVFIQTINNIKSCHVPQDTKDSYVSLTDNILPDVKETASETKIMEESKFCIGFKTAKGNSVSISEKYLCKARSLFADLEQCEEMFDLKGEQKCVVQKHPVHDNATEPSLVTCNNGLLYYEKITKAKTEGSLCKNKTLVKTDTRTYYTANLENAQSSMDQKLDLRQVNTVNFGFSTAGGKQLNISEKSLLKAKNLLNEVTNSEEAHNYDAAVSLKSSLDTKTLNSKKTSLHNRSTLLDSARHDSGLPDQSLKDKEKNPENCSELRREISRCHSSKSIQNKGYKMASGKVGPFSASAIDKSKAYFKDINSSVNSSDETKSKEESAKLDLEAERSQPLFVNGFKMASGKGVSFSEKAFMKSKAFFKDCDLEIEDHSQSKRDNSSVMAHLGFKTVVGNKAHSVDIDSLNKEAASLNEEPTVLNKYVKMEFTKTSTEIVLPGCGFSTASGKTVSVSSEALRKAKAVFDNSNDASPCAQTMEISEEEGTSKTETTFPGQSRGFSTARGRNVTISDKALEKAKSLFTGCELDGLAPEHTFLNSEKKSVVDPKQIRGFSTASGKDVPVSEQSMKKAKAMFANCDDNSVDNHVTENHLTTQRGQQKSYYTKCLSGVNKCIPPNVGSSEVKYEDGNPKSYTFKTGNVGFSTASGKGVSVSNSALQVASEIFRDCNEQPRIIKTGSVQIGETNDATALFSSQAIHNSSLLNCHSLNINECTMTQQKYLEQEAMACTKALLEDDLNEHTLVKPLEDPGITENAVPQQRSLEATTRERKRLSSDDLTDQPPLKRRLISEFEQISDTSRDCASVKSSPNGTLRDRRAFKYNLKPNVTCPSRNVMDQIVVHPGIQTSNDQKRDPSNSKAVVFVPPFRKNIKPEPQTHCDSRHDAKVPKVFVPPVKKDTLATVKNISRSLQNPSDADYAVSSSSGCEHNMAALEVEPKTVEKHDEMKEKEVNEEENLEDPTPVTSEEVTETWQRSLELAQDMQDMRIRKKKRQTIHPLPGSFYLAKTSGVARMSLRVAVQYKCPLQHTQEELYQYGVHCNVSQITAENAESFRFRFDDFFKREVFIEYTGVQLADGGWLIPNNEGTMGKEEFYRALCDSPGVDPNLISEAWVFNHYRWIVWKRACMERAFPEVMGSRCLTPEQVLLQLKLRYDTEVDHSLRSALKKIIERDDTPAKTLVLCVCGFAKSDRTEERSEKAVDTANKESPAVVIWLTDGWYSIKALLDPPLSVLLQKGCLRVGEKIVIHGAELIGSQDACPPLEAPDSLMLKISANSTRRARWDTKLGFHKDPRPFNLPLSSLYPNGGMVGCVDIIVLRSYPTQWMEKKAGGVFVFRNERAEDREARRHSSEKQKAMELLFSKMQAQIENEEEEKNKTRRRRRYRRHEIEKMLDGEELSEAMESDPAFVESHLSAVQMEALSRYRRSLTERKQVELQERIRRAVQESEEAEGGCRNRDVTPVWKLAITDFNDLHRTCSESDWVCG